MTGRINSRKFYAFIPKVRSHIELFSQILCHSRFHNFILPPTTSNPKIQIYSPISLSLDLKLKPKSHSLFLLISLSLTLHSRLSQSKLISLQSVHFSSLNSGFALRFPFPVSIEAFSVQIHQLWNHWSSFQIQSKLNSKPLLFGSSLFSSPPLPFSRL